MQIATRRPNTTRQGYHFNDATIQAVWNKAQRKDRCGAIIDRGAFGDTTENGTGWEIDHIQPVAKGGSDDLTNLQPLQWQNNRAKGDNYPAASYCVVTARQ
jgi:hypothetical protein